jgi:hypothetical protein
MLLEALLLTPLFHTGSAAISSNKGMTDLA